MLMLLIDQFIADVCDTNLSRIILIQKILINFVADVCDTKISRAIMIQKIVVLLID